MKSSIRIDYLDPLGNGIQPVIKVEIIKSDDPRDTLLSHLFQSVQGENMLQFHYGQQKSITTSEGLPDLEKTIYLFKPDHSPKTN